MKINSKEYSLLDFDSSEEEIFKELESTKYRDLEDLVYRMQLPYDEIIDILDKKFIPTKRTGYSLPPRIYKVSHIDLMLKSLLPNDVKVSNTIDNNKFKVQFK